MASDFVLNSVSGVAADWEIKSLAENHKMIGGFEEFCPKGVISYGLTSYGYDYRLGDHIKLILPGKTIDPKNPQTSADALSLEHRPVTGSNAILLPAHSTCLSYSVESFKLPVNCIGLSIGKSTYARCGVLVNVTPAEPEWEGHLTLEISNISDSDVYLYAGEGIAQMIFFFGKSNPLVTYKTKKGKYQGQTDKIVVATANKHHEEVGNSSHNQLAPPAEQVNDEGLQEVHAGVGEDIQANSDSV